VLQAVDDAGHWVHHDQLETVVASVRSFLGDSLA
jgi:pimeloyl-ACP methyl ester carboxylesterase